MRLGNNDDEDNNEIDDNYDNYCMVSSGLTSPS